MSSLLIAAAVMFGAAWVFTAWPVFLWLAGLMLAGGVAAVIATGSKPAARRPGAHRGR